MISSLIPHLNDAFAINSRVSSLTKIIRTDLIKHKLLSQVFKLKGATGTLHYFVRPT